METAISPARTEIPPYAGPWFDSPFFDLLLERSDLSAEEREEVERFARDGFLILDRHRLGIDDFDALAEQVIADTEGLYQGVTRVQEAWKLSESVRALAIAPGVLDVLRRLYQREPVPFQTLNFKYGTQQGTHSDTFHFHCLPKFFLCGVWVALEDVDEKNGPVHYYSGSHRLPDYDVLDLDVPAVGNRSTDPLGGPYDRFVGGMLERSGLPRERLIIEKGQALIWAANLYHGGDPIEDPSRTRYSQVTHYYFDGCVPYSPMRSDRARGKVAFQRITNIRTGEPEPLQYKGKRVPVSLSDMTRWYAPAIMQRLGVWRKDSRRL